MFPKFTDKFSKKKMCSVAPFPCTLPLIRTLVLARNLPEYRLTASRSHFSAQKQKAISTVREVYPHLDTWYFFPFIRYTQSDKVNKLARLLLWL